MHADNVNPVLHPPSAGFKESRCETVPNATPRPSAARDHAPPTHPKPQPRDA